MAMARIKWYLLYLIIGIFIIENAILLFPYIKSLVLQLETSRAEKGKTLAKKMGCFSCHGPEGSGGVPNRGAAAKEVPSLDGGMILMGVKNDAEIAEYIRDGLPNRKKWDKDYYDRYQNQLIKMPAYKKHLNEKEIELLVSTIKSLNGLPRPKDDRVLEGENLTIRMGCTTCHGPRGNAGIKNPGSFKGYIPGWWGDDFRELVKNDEELYSWIRKGKIERFERNPLASFFTRRQIIKMPAFENYLSEKKIAMIAEYLKWLNQESWKSD
jgi:mono/diheme cytochrome c family protein